MTTAPTPAPWSRRALLRHLGAATLLAPSIAAGCARREANEEAAGASRIALWDAGIVPEDGAAKRLGRLYRQRHPDQSSLDDLCRELGGDAAPVTAEAWRNAAAHALRGDLEAGNTLELDGWIMTRTEGRLLALATFR